MEIRTLTSIHAPATTPLSEGVFQSTPPRGGRPQENVTLYLWGLASHESLTQPSTIFDPRLHWGKHVKEGDSYGIANLPRISMELEVGDTELHHQQIGHVG